MNSKAEGTAALLLLGLHLLPHFSTSLLPPLPKTTRAGKAATEEKGTVTVGK